MGKRQELKGRSRHTEKKGVVYNILNLQKISSNNTKGHLGCIYTDPYSLELLSLNA